jgi:hypothetical protein
VSQVATMKIPMTPTRWKEILSTAIQIKCFFLFGFFIALRFPPSFSPLFCLCVSTHLGFISSLPQLAWD